MAPTVWGKDLSFPGRFGNRDISSAPEDEVHPLPLGGDKFGGTTYPELPAKDGDFAFNLFLS